MIDFGTTHNFITEAEARRLRLRWEKDSERMKAIDDFDVIMGMEFLLEHQVIPMPSAKCLVITGSFPIVVQADIRQPNRFKMISAMQLDKNPAQEEPPSAAILLGALGKLGDTIPKDTLCVPKKYHGVKASAKNAYGMLELAELRKSSKKLLSTGFSRPVQAPYGVPVLSPKKNRNPQRCTKHRILNKLTASRKYPFPILPYLFDRSRGVKYFPKSDIRPRYCRVRAIEAEGLETTSVTGLRAYEFPMVPFSLTDAKGGKLFCAEPDKRAGSCGGVSPN
ncbi:reverse transcriptase [Cucumis melo var. makuwa]|uniref:Reverse transcriptase n=1 Tax=Cucumis melo var. makuwa TaxID=1194695 RepID=A0A5D3CAT9_CUCMM|nr:reverse transcriptase [Cucumis melo var. makuwa]TYK08460.1 reverse transcriptase [Cucumis melo var. makuwa]